MLPFIRPRATRVVSDFHLKPQVSFISFFYSYHFSGQRRPEIENRKRTETSWLAQLGLCQTCAVKDRPSDITKERHILVHFQMSLQLGIYQRRCPVTAMNE